jgi:sensor histidine kinase YesM
VENAVRHGIAKQTEPGRITIRARQQSNRLIMQVEDNGPGLKPTSNGSVSGIGLTNTRARLEQCYGDDFSFQIVNSNGRGVTVTVNIPANLDL